MREIMKIVDGKKVAETPEEQMQLDQELATLQAQQDQGTTPSIDQNAFFQVMRETEQARQVAEQRARQAEDELTNLRNQRQQNQVQQQEQKPDKDQFFDDPHGALDSAISKQLKPVLNFIEILSKQSAYTNLKNQYKNQYPAFANIESIVDQMMQGQEATHQNMQVAIERAVGRAALLGAQNPNNQQQAPAPLSNNNNPDPKVVGTIQPDLQAHMRPSPRQVNNKNDTPQRRPLTENERRVIKETQKSIPSFNEEMYFAQLEAGPQVSTWKVEKK